MYLRKIGFFGFSSTFGLDLWPSFFKRTKYCQFESILTIGVLQTKWTLFLQPSSFQIYVVFVGWKTRSPGKPPSPRGICSHFIGLPKIKMNPKSSQMSKGLLLFYPFPFFSISCFKGGLRHPLWHRWRKGERERKTVRAREFVLPWAVRKNKTGKIPRARSPRGFGNKKRGKSTAGGPVPGAR